MILEMSRHKQDRLEGSNADNKENWGLREVEHPNHPIYLDNIKHQNTTKVPMIYTNLITKVKTKIQPKAHCIVPKTNSTMNKVQITRFN